ncbi:MAG: hypothetical protein HY929_08780 [Euryarchaeota archaeon]|nr:hypothetical protein [Euryarchaeota archaeon]
MVNDRKLIPVYVFSLFLITFGLARIVVRSHLTFELLWKGYRIHHFFFGIILSLIGGWIALNQDGSKWIKAASILYGIGLGLIIDEIGLLLTWGNYWARVTYDIFIALVLIFLIFIFLKKVS